MGCINCISTKDGKYTTAVITSNLTLETNEKRKFSKLFHDNLDKKKLFEEKKQSVVTQNIEELIENNPLPFVKIRRKSKPNF